MKEIFKKIWELALPYQDKRDDPGHAEVTLRYARELVAIEKGDEDIVIPAIILHDVGYSQLPKERRISMFSPETRNEDRMAIVFEHQIESIKLASKILRQVNYPAEMNDEILEIISQHDTRKGFISKNEGLVRDADKLWRTSKEGTEVSEVREKAREGDRFNRIEAGIKKPDYFYSETARQMALAEVKTRMGLNSAIKPEGSAEITDEEMRQMISKSKNYCLVILKSTAKRNEAGADKIVREHGRRNFVLRAEARRPIVCTVTEGSDISEIGVFKASLDETRKIMDENPGVKAGIFKYEVHDCRGFPGSSLPG
jgi:hypothetical protein